MPNIEDSNYTSTILKYANLALPFPQLKTNAKTVVYAINELYDTKSTVIPNPPDTPTDTLYTVKIDGDTYRLSGGSTVIPNPPIPPVEYGCIITESGEIIITQSGDTLSSGEGGEPPVIPKLYTIGIDGEVYEIAGGSYVLPIASAETLGGIKVGSGLAIDSQTGVLSTSGGGYTAGNGIYFLQNAADTYISDSTYTHTLEHQLFEITSVIANGTPTTSYQLDRDNNSITVYASVGSNIVINYTYETSYGTEINADAGRIYRKGNPGYGESKFTSESHLGESGLYVRDWDWHHDSATQRSMYRSDGGTYGFTEGLSLCKIEVIGYSKLTIYVKQDDVNGNQYEYVLLGGVNYNNVDSGVAKSFKGETTSDYVAYTYELSNNSGYGAHNMYSFVMIGFKKVAGSSTDSRGYFYFEVSEPYVYGNGEYFNAYEYNVAAGNHSHAEGYSTKALGQFSHTEGDFTIAAGSYGHAEGAFSRAIGNQSAHAEGYETVASGTTSSHAEGYMTVASGDNSHAEGRDTIASGWRSHAEGGRNTIASGLASHAEGEGSVASSYSSHAEGRESKATSEAAHAEGYRTKSTSNGSHSEGYETHANGLGSHSEGDGTHATDYVAHAEGYNTTANAYAHSEGYYTEANANFTHSEGYYAIASGIGSHAEGYSISSAVKNTASGIGSHVEGSGTTASGDYSHSEGRYTVASGVGAHAEGFSDVGTEIVASGRGAHAEGFMTSAAGMASHAEGGGSKALGQESHAEGGGTVVYGNWSHGEGAGNTAYAYFSHVEGAGTKSFEVFTHVEGAGNNNIAQYSHLEGGGNRTTSSAHMSHTEGAGNTNYGHQSHIEGSGNRVSGEESHVEGAGNEVHGPKTHAEGGGNTAYTIGSHVEGKHNFIAGFGVHAEGSFNCIGSTTSVPQFSYGTTYAVGDIVGVNDNYVRHGNELTDPLLFRCITAPGQIQAGTGIEIVTADSWDSSVTYPANSLVKFTDGPTGYYRNSSEISAGGNPPPANSNWQKISQILSPMVGKSGATTHFTYAYGNGQYTGWWLNGNDTAQTIVSVTVDGVATSATLEQGGRIIRLPFAPANGAYVIMEYYVVQAYEYSYYLLDVNSEIGYNNPIAKVQNIVSISPMWEAVATPKYAHIEGFYNIALGDYQHVGGKFNSADANKAVIIGNGADGNSRANAYTLDWDGNATFAGDVTLGTPLSTTAQTVAAAINELYQTGGGSQVSVTQKVSTGTNIADIIVDGVTTQLFAPTSGGSNVVVTPVQLSGNHIADIEVDGVTSELYSPEYTPTEVEVTQVQSSGTKIATIGVDGNETDIYAPDAGDSVTVTQITTTGTHIADIEVDGVTTELYAPNAGGAVIDDSDIALDKTWSSQKINEMFFELAQRVAAIERYLWGQPVLTEEGDNRVTEDGAQRILEENEE
jgi:hypothetical protein